MKHITVTYVIKLHNKLINSSGGSMGLRERILLESAIENSKVTFDGIDLYPTIEEKCSAICYSLVNNHSFVDGNKRIGLYVLLVLLEYNNISLVFSQKELVSFGLSIAKGELNQKDILNWVNSHKK